MSYIWVIVGSGVALILTTYSRWHMSNVSYEPIERSNDPYVYLIGVIIILHFFYFGAKTSDIKIKNKKLNKIFKNDFVGIVLILGLLIILGIVGSYIVDLILY